MKVRLLQNYNNRELLAGRVVDGELSEAVKRDLVKDGKAEEIREKKKAVNRGKK